MNDRREVHRTDPFEIGDVSRVISGGSDKNTSSVAKYNTWSTLAAFIVIFGSIGSYFLFSSHADVVPAGSAFTMSVANPENGLLYYQQLTSIREDGLHKVTPTATLITAYTSRVISPDGTTMAYFTPNGAAGNPTFTLKTSKLDGTDQKMIVANITVMNTPHIAWSSDNQWLAYGQVSSDPTNTSATSTITIGLVHPDGSGLHSIPNVSISSSDGFGGLTWTRNNDSVLYVETTMNNHSKLCNSKINGANTKCTALPNSLAQHYSNPQLSPDGRKLLFIGSTQSLASATKAQEQDNVFVSNIDGSTMTQLTKLPVGGPEATVSVFDAVWSPNSRSVAYGLFVQGAHVQAATSTYSGLYVMNADGRIPVRIDPTLTGRSALGWQSTTIGLVTVAPIAATSKSPVPGNFSAYMSGSRIGHIDSVTKAVYYTNLSRQPSIPASLSPDGTQVAYATVTADNRSQLIVEYSTGTSSRVIYVYRDRSLSDISWSSDGKLLAFRTDSQTIGPNGNPLETVAVISQDGSNFHELSVVTNSEITFITGLTWFPNSTKLLYIADGTTYCTVDANNAANQCGTRQADLATIAVAGNQKGAEDFPVISPDGSKVLLSPVSGADTVINNGGRSTTTRQTVYITSIDGSNAKAIGENGPGYTSRAATWSPDGQQVAYAFRHETSGTTTTGSVVKTALKIMHADGSNKQIIAPIDLAYSLNWQSLRQN